MRLSKRCLLVAVAILIFTPIPSSVIADESKVESLVKQCGAEFRDILGKLEDSAKKKGLKLSRRARENTEIWKNVITHSFMYIIKNSHWHPPSPTE